MTVPADQLQIVKVQSDRWILDVLRSELDLVMYDLAWNNKTFGKANLTETADLPEV